MAMDKSTIGQDNIKISVVVATLRRPRLLERLLDSLLIQSVDSNMFEVIVVDNAPERDEEVTRLCQSEKYAPLVLINLHNEVIGVSRARNVGTSHARADYVAYLDDDAYLPDTWIENAIRVQETIAPAIFGGPYRAYYTSDKPIWLLDEYMSGTLGDEAHWLTSRQYLFGTNLVWKKDLIVELGGFSPILGGGSPLDYGEETEIQYKALKRGERIWYDPELYVYHHANPRKMYLGWFIKDRWAHGKAKALIFRKEIQEDKRSKLRAFLSWLKSVALKTFVVIGLLLTVPFYNRHKYLHYQNYVIEKICPKISGLSMAFYSANYYLKS